MSTATRGDVKTEEDRAGAVTRMLCEALGLSIPKTQLKLLTIALAEIATEEIYQDPSFAQRLKVRFEGLLPKPIEKKTPEKKQDHQPRQKLIQIKHIEADRLNPYGIPDPYALLEAFGEAQLPLALKGYSLALLNKVAAELQSRFPNTQPGNKRQKDSVVDYIVFYVVKGN